MAVKWPGARVVEIWNSLPGVEPVRRFTSRQVAAARLWKAIQQLKPANGAAAAGAVEQGWRQEQGSGPSTARTPEHQDGRSDRSPAPAPGRHAGYTDADDWLASSQRAGVHQREGGQEDGLARALVPTRPRSCLCDHTLTHHLLKLTRVSLPHIPGGNPPGCLGLPCLMCQLGLVTASRASSVHRY